MARGGRLRLHYGGYGKYISQVYCISSENTLFFKSLDTQSVVTGRRSRTSAVIPIRTHIYLAGAKIVLAVLRKLFDKRKCCWLGTRSPARTFFRVLCWILSFSYRSASSSLRRIS